MVDIGTVVGSVTFLCILEVHEGIMLNYCL